MNNVFLNVCIAIGLVGGYIVGGIFWTPWFGIIAGAITGTFAGLLFRPDEKKDINEEEK